MEKPLLSTYKTFALPIQPLQTPSFQGVLLEGKKVAVKRLSTKSLQGLE